MASEVLFSPHPCGSAGKVNKHLKSYPAEAQRDMKGKMRRIKFD
jgi:hypothetical protein